MKVSLFLILPRMQTWLAASYFHPGISSFKAKYGHKASVLEGL